MTRRALLLASTSYSDDFATLDAPLSDLPTLAGALEAPSLGAFDSVEFEFDLPQRELATTIERWLAASAPEDTVLLYLAGHGQAYGHDKYLLYAPDSAKATPFSTSLTAHLLQELLDRCRAAGQMIILDTCDAAAAAERIIRGRGPQTSAAQMDPRLALGVRRSRDLVRYVLYAASLDNDAWEIRSETSGRSYSLLLSCLLFGLRQRMYTPQTPGQVTLADLHPFIEYAVRRFADTTVSDPLAPRPLTGSLLRAQSSALPYIARDGVSNDRAALQTLFDEPDYLNLAEELARSWPVAHGVTRLAAAALAKDAQATYLAPLSETIELNQKLSTATNPPSEPTPADLATVIRRNGGQVRRGQLLAWLVQQFSVTEQTALDIVDFALNAEVIGESGPYYTL